MTDKVNPNNSDKIADRIAGAIVDYCYTQQENPNVDICVSFSENMYNITAYSSVEITVDAVGSIIKRITGNEGIILNLFYTKVDNIENIECDTSDIFEAYPTNSEELEVSNISSKLFEMAPFDGRYVLDESNNKLTVYQSRMRSTPIKSWLKYKYPNLDIVVNPYGEWIDKNKCGCSNHRLESDFGHTLTNKHIHGKDCVKTEVCMSIYAWLLAQSTGEPQKFQCNKGDTVVNGIPYEKIIDTSKEFIDMLGGYESLATWGLI